MKHNNLFLWLLGLTVCWLALCSEEDGRVTYPYSCPEISELQFSTTDQTPTAESLFQQSRHQCLSYGSTAN